MRKLCQEKNFCENTIPNWLLLLFVVLSITVRTWPAVRWNEENLESSLRRMKKTSNGLKARQNIYQRIWWTNPKDQFFKHLEALTYLTVVRELWLNVWPLSDQEHFKLFFFSLLALQPNSTVSFYHHLIQINLGRKPCISAGRKQNLSTFSKTFWQKSKKVCSLLKQC